MPLLGKLARIKLRLIVPQNLAENFFSASIRLPSNSQETHMKKKHWKMDWTSMTHSRCHDDRASTR